MSNHILKNFMLSVDGRGEVGEMLEYSPPSLEILQESYRGGGMDAEDQVDMGMAALEVSFKMSGYTPETMALWGLGQGNDVSLTARGYLKSADGTSTAMVHNMRGRIVKLESETWTAGGKSSPSYTVKLKYYKCTHGSTVLHEIDVPGAVRIINGTDQLSEMRTALGI